jgi:hypothetical protein
MTCISYWLRSCHDLDSLNPVRSLLCDVVHRRIYFRGVKVSTGKVAWTVEMGSIASKTCRSPRFARRGRDLVQQTRVARNQRQSARRHPVTEYTWFSREINYGAHLSEGGRVQARQQVRGMCQTFASLGYPCATRVLASHAIQ